MSSTPATKPASKLPVSVFVRPQPVPVSPVSSLASSTCDHINRLFREPSVVVEEEDGGEDQPMEEEEEKEREGKEREEEREEQALLAFQSAPALHNQRPPPSESSPVRSLAPTQVDHHPHAPFSPANPSAHPPAPPALFNGAPASNAGIPVNPVGSNEVPSRSGGMKRNREENQAQIDIRLQIHASRKAKARLDQMLNYIERASTEFGQAHIDDASVGVGYPSSTYRHQDSAQETGVIQKRKSKRDHIEKYNKSVDALQATLELMSSRLVSAFNSAYALHRAEATLTSQQTKAERKAEEERAKKQQKQDDAILLLQGQQELDRELAPYSARSRQ